MPTLPVISLCHYCTSRQKTPPLPTKHFEHSRWECVEAVMLLRGVRGASPLPEEVGHIGHLDIHARQSVGCVGHCGRRVGKCFAARGADHAVSSLAVPPEIGPAARSSMNWMSSPHLPPAFHATTTSRHLSPANSSAYLRSLVVNPITGVCFAVRCQGTPESDVNRELRTVVQLEAPMQAFRLLSRLVQTQRYPCPSIWSCIAPWLPPHGKSWPVSFRVPKLQCAV